MIIKDFSHLQWILECYYIGAIEDGVIAYLEDNTQLPELRGERIITEAVDVARCKLRGTVIDSVQDGDFIVESRVEVAVTLKGKRVDCSLTGVERKLIYLNVAMSVEFDDTLNNVSVICVEHMLPQDKLVNNGLNTLQMLPQIQSPEDADKYAETLLKKYYPQALETPVELPIFELMGNMGLKVKTVNHEKGVYGRCYLVDEYRLTKSGKKLITKKGTVTYKDSQSDTGKRRTNFTLAHEAAHWIFNKEYFVRMNAIDPNFSHANYSEITAIDSENPYYDDIVYMEKQADMLASRILMPACTAKEKFKEYICDGFMFSEDEPTKIYELAIKQFADFFNVSISAAKIRLLELGFNEIKGIYDYVNGRYAKSYLYDTSKVGAKESFSVGFEEALEISYSNNDLRLYLEEEKIIYIDGFFVINSPVYVRMDSNHKCELTDYALEHMDECCLVFECIKDKKSPRNLKTISSVFLDRKDNSPAIKKLTFDGPSNISKQEELSGFADDFAEMDEAFHHIKNMNGTFGEALKYIFENMDGGRISLRAVMHETYVSERKLSKAINEENILFNKKEVVALCIGLHLDPRVSKHLLGLAGFDLELTRNRQDWCYSFIMNYYREMELSQVNKILEQSGHIDWQLP